jgi:hypothetical protein
MKRIVFALFTIYCSLFTCLAQTITSPYRPGVTTDGAVYFLPKTAIRVTVQVEKTTYTPGEFCKYADRYLRLKDVPVSASETYRITAIRQEATAVADTTKGYTVKFDPKTVASNIALSDDGVLLAINATPKAVPLQAKFTPAPQPEMADPRQYMSEEILAAGSSAKMAELTAQDIYEIRESRNLLVRGQADNMPKDGAQLQLMLHQLDVQDRSLTSLFAGTTVRDTVEHSFTIVPNKDTDCELLFRFSKKLGMVDDDDLAGVPYYIKITNLHTAPMPDADSKKKQKQEQGVYVNVPGKMKSIIFNASENLVTTEFPAAQFGNVELLSGVLFNKRYTTRLWLNPVTGAVDRLEADEPK